MNQDRVKETVPVPAHKKRFREWEQESYRRKYLGAIFLTILLQKIAEKEWLGEDFVPAGYIGEVMPVSPCAPVECAGRAEQCGDKAQRTCAFSGTAAPADRRKIVWTSGDILELTLPQAGPEPSGTYNAFAIVAVKC